MPKKIQNIFKYIEENSSLVVNGCIEYRGTIVPDGYGSVRFNGRRTRVHRLVYESLYGSVGDMSICHRCDNRKCINIAHLFVGTNNDNVADRHKKGRNASGEKNGMSKLSALDISNIRNDPRTLRELAQVYNVHLSNIGLIKQRKTWNNTP